MTADIFPSLLSSFGLVAIAEIGDKSQLVCMALAARHPHWPVFWGASTAFMLLNLIAVLFGVSVASWIPESVLTAAVTLLFFAFGLQALLAKTEEEDIDLNQAPSRSIFMTTLAMIVMSEFGDKTQIAVAGLSTSMPLVAVWLGASLALILLTALGVWLGKALLKTLPLQWLQRIAGALFLTFATFAGYRLFTLF